MVKAASHKKNLKMEIENLRRWIKTHRRVDMSLKIVYKYTI